MPDFHHLRALLEAEAQPPSFDEIRGRRRRRNQRLAMSVTAVAVVVALAAGAVVSGVLTTTGPRHQPPASPVVTPTPESSDPTAVAPELVHVQAGTGGELVGLVRRCDTHCDDPAAAWTYRLVRSTDLGRTWQRALDWPSPASTFGTTLLSSAPALFVVDPNGTVSASPDDGRTWLASASTSGWLGQTSPGAAGGTFWLIGGTNVYTWADVATATPTIRITVLPTTARKGLAPNGRLTLLPIGASSSLLVRQDDPTVAGPAARDDWYQTSDRGQTWTTIDDPCPAGLNLRFESATAPDGSAWLTCIGGGDAGGRVAKAFLVSNGEGPGRTWHSRGAGDAVLDGGDATIVPFSATMAWRWGPNSTVERMTDGVHWVDVGPPGLTQDGVTQFAAVDPLRAMAIATTTDNQTKVFLTTDGGAHWSSSPLHLPA
jgi:hypothetical protein